MSLSLGAPLHCVSDGVHLISSHHHKPPTHTQHSYGVERHRVLEGGDWLFGLGEQVDCRAKPETCLKLTVKLTEYYFPVCEAACQAFGRVHGACGPIWGHARAVNDTRVKTLHGGSDFDACHALCRKQNDWRWNMVDCLREVAIEPRALCPKAGELCRNPF